MDPEEFGMLLAERRLRRRLVFWLAYPFLTFVAYSLVFLFFGGPPPLIADIVCVLILGGVIPGAVIWLLPKFEEDEIFKSIVEEAEKQ